MPQFNHSSHPANLPVEQTAEKQQSFVEQTTQQQLQDALNTVSKCLDHTPQALADLQTTTNQFLVDPVCHANALKDQFNDFAKQFQQKTIPPPNQKRQAKSSPTTQDDG